MLTREQTLYEKLWQSHWVGARIDGADLIYIDRHLIHEVTSPIAFSRLASQQRTLRRKETIFATTDHNVATESTSAIDLASQQQIACFVENGRKHDFPVYPVGHARQGIVHVSAPEQGLILPGSSVVCGDSHTATHGAFAALAFGIGTSDIAHVLVTQCIALRRLKTMNIQLTGHCGSTVSAKDVILYVIARLGVDAGVGYAVEFTGSVIEVMTMEQRMTVCNMAIELGARTGLIAVDNTTIAYLSAIVPALSTQGHPAATAWSQLHSDRDAVFDKTVTIDCSAITPQVSWGTSPDMTLGINEQIPYAKDIINEQQRHRHISALDYMGLHEGTTMANITVDKVFIGSCTNSRIEDLRIAANIAQGQHVAVNIKSAIVVPGSQAVKHQAEQEGLDKIFNAAGFQWRSPGCSMCIAMNNDKLDPFERCASTSNRNFEGRQGAQGRTHLVSPAMAATAAIHGHFKEITA